MIQHDARCDRDHTPRQRCNRRMTPADARVARLATDGESDVRAALATIEPPEPTVFVSREWSETVAAVERANRPSVAVASRPTEHADPGRTAALVGGALGFLLLLTVVWRGRT